VALALVTSAEGRGNEVDALYQRYLHRAADPGGRAFFASALAQGLREEAIVDVLVGSDEYAGQV
jgi:hypothetical protein